MKDRKVIYADISLFVVAFIWGSGFVVTKSALDYMTPYYILGFRFTIAAFILTLISFKRLRKAKWEDIKAGLVVGVLMFIGFATQTVGLQYTTVGTQAFITASNVVMVPFFYWLLTRRKPNRFEVFGAILCFFGIGLLSLDDNMKIGYGEFLTFICAVSFALQIVTVGYFAKKVDSYVLTAVQLYLAAAFAFAFAFAMEPPITGLSTQGMVAVLYLGVFSTMIAFLVQNIAQKYTSSTHTAIILSLEAVFGSVLGIIILNESITGKFLVGCMAIFLAVLASETRFEFMRKNGRKTLA